MEPMTLLIYVSTFIIAIVGTLLSVFLFKVIRIMNRIEHIVEFVERIQSYVEYLESWPVALIKKLFKK
ncbi:MAG: hypothetical protein PHO80_02060 [Candidatus Gracilibacteria bacterium]|nr:hypothetical protein [Candidatus Gracilibacteria bacterium]